MLDAFKKRGAGDDGKPAKEQVAELKELVGQAREERAALSTMLTQIEMQGSKLSTLGRTLQEVTERAGPAEGKMEDLTGQLSTLDRRFVGLEEVGNRAEMLRTDVGKVEESVRQLLAPDGDFEKRRQAMEQLSAQAVQNVAQLDAIKKEQSTLDDARERLRVAQRAVAGAASTTAALKGDVDRLRGLSGQLTQDHALLKDSLRETFEQATATTAAVKDIEAKLGPLSQMQELGRDTETQLSTLNSLAEHVLQKVRVLENQKHTVEHAVVESNRLNELVWGMDVQVAKLNDGAQQAAQVEQTVNRIEGLASEAMARLDLATTSRDSFTRELEKLEQGRAQLTDFVRGCTERLTVERKELDSFDQRVTSLQSGLRTVEESVGTLLDRESDLTALDQRTEGIAKRVASLAGQAEELQKGQAELDSLHGRLAQLDELTKRTNYQFEALEKSRGDLDGLRKEIQQFYKTHAEVTKTVETLAADKKTFEGFLQRTDEFRRQIPVLDSRIGDITTKLSVVDEGTQKAATLVALAEDLDRQMRQIAEHQQVVEQVDARLNALNALSSDVDGHMQEQLARRAEVESLKSFCDGLAIQVADARLQVDGINVTQQKLLPLTTQVAELRSSVDKTEAAFRSVQQDDAAIVAQEKRLADLVDQSRAVGSEVEARMHEIHGLTTDLGAGKAIKEELVEELGRVQGRQRDVITQVRLSEDQLKRVDQQLKQLDQRRSQFAFADKKLVAFEGRLGELSEMSKEVERQIETVEARQAFVGAVKAEVDEVQQISARSRADLQDVVEHRADVDALRGRVDEALTGIAETEDRIGVIEARRKVVDDVQRKTGVIVNVLEDVGSISRWSASRRP